MTKAPPRSPYEVLGVSPSATKAEVKRAFREQVKTCHPDLLEKNASESTKRALEAKFKVLNGAYSAITKSHSAGHFGHGGQAGSAQFYRAATRPRAVSNGLLAAVLAGPLVMLGFMISRRGTEGPTEHTGEMKIRPYGFWYPPHNPFLKDDLRPTTKERRW
jgi:curved DNA-binding protein CbpA